MENGQVFDQSLIDHQIIYHIAKEGINNRHFVFPSVQITTSWPSYHLSSVSPTGLLWLSSALPANTLKMARLSSCFCSLKVSNARPLRLLAQPTYLLESSSPAALFPRRIVPPTRIRIFSTLIDNPSL